MLESQAIFTEQIGEGGFARLRRAAARFRAAAE
jgi:hypothetical protein